MGKPNPLFVKKSFLILSFLQALTCAAWGQAPAVPAKTPELYFSVSPSKQLFLLSEPMKIDLELYSRSNQPLLISREWGKEFVSFEVTGPDGKEVPWQGKARSVSKEYAASDFTVLGQFKQFKADRVISLKDGAGFRFETPGQYTLSAEFSMGPKEDFAPFAGQAMPPEGSFHAKALFCIEACILEPRQVSANVPQAAIDTVRKFYTYITKYQQLGIPHGPLREALWPLMSKRLAQELDSFHACDADYYRRYGEFLRANTYKPSTPWLEAGLFTGQDDAATPRKFTILSSRSVGDDRVDVHLQFPEPENCCSDRPPYFYTDGDVTLVLENGRWVIDDYLSMYANDDLRRLSAGFPQCKDGKWIGRGP